MSAEFIDLNKEFHLGNRFTLDTAQHLAKMLDDRFRVVVKYDKPNDLPRYNDDKLNIVFATSRETHDVPNEFFREDVFAIFQHYFMLDRWGYPVHNPLSYPLPLGTFKDPSPSLEIKPLAEREYDFCFMGQIPHTGTRDCFKRALDNLIEETGDKFKYFVKVTDGFNQGLDKDEYFDILGNSKVCLCPQGAHSTETFRFFESIMLGSIPVVDTLPRLWYYEEAPHFTVKWREIDNNLSKILNFIQTPMVRNTLHQIGHYCNQVMNPIKLASHLREKLEFKLQNVNQHKHEIEKIRKKISELDTI